MVTIEQKLLLFSKLLHQAMNSKFADELDEIEKEYEIKINKNREMVDKEAEYIIRRSREKGEAERTEYISKMKMNIKMGSMAVKEKYYDILIEHIKGRLKDFVSSDRYELYIVTLLEKFKEVMPSADHMTIYMTKQDKEKYEKTVVKELARENKQYTNISFEIATDDIIGGLVAIEFINSIRVDMSIKAVLEDNKQYIMQTLFESLEAGGDSE